MSTDDMKVNRLTRGRQSSIDGGTSIGMRQKDQSQESQMTEDCDFFFIIKSNLSNTITERKQSKILMSNLKFLF